MLHANMKILKNLHPTLQVVARGHVIKIYGNENEVRTLTDNLTRIESYALNNNNLTEENIIEIVKGNQPNEITFDNLILHGVNGKSIMARSANQQKLVKDFETNDLLFAIGPAGSGKTYTAGVSIKKVSASFSVIFSAILSSGVLSIKLKRRARSCLARLCPPERNTYSSYTTE